MTRLSFIVTIVAVALVCVFAQELYSDRYDDVDLDGILANEKLRIQYYNCFMDTSPCKTADAKFFKGIAGEAMQSQCRRCTEKQKEILN
ncbi:PREDICTED: putative odorant-binding protein A10, partial [Vollenhovia emeryi]|uniref:putative odorant-binding protein A10 n=1 Tax=Vollenhovia emeryi TaxID=411798 RepID=UPI0005F38DF5